MTESERELFRINGLLEQHYGRQVSKFFRENYSQNAVEAIINNYLLDPENEKYKAEFLEMQAYRAECKARAKKEVYGEET